MGQRRSIVGGNWKMNTNRAGAVALARAVAAMDVNPAEVEVVVFPPAPYLLSVKEALGASSVMLGAQNVYHEPDGAFTGEVSVSMLVDCGCRWVLTGHSERRHVIGENDELINCKTRAALDSGLKVILCVGETREQRDAGQTDEINRGQVTQGLAGVSGDQLDRLVIAYEPVWAIGTGLTATPADAQSAHAAIRGVVADLYDQAAADALRIQYGGSVKPNNATDLFGCADIDGGLIGGASLKADDFKAIVHAAARQPV